MFHLPSVRGFLRGKALNRGQPVRFRPMLVALEDRSLPSVTLFPVPALSQPNSDLTEIAPGRDGNLWFTEPEANRIGRITPAGVVTEFHVPTPNSLPGGITAGPGGNLWFTEDQGQRIGQISPSGTITEFPLPAGDLPSEITAGPDGNVWFTASNNGSAKIGRLTPTGQLTEFALSRFDAAGGITAGPDGNLWFTTRAGQSIGRITPAGAITEFPIPLVPFTNPLSNLFYPWTITAGLDGNLWFTEAVSSAIGRLTPTGTFTTFSLPAHSVPRFITAGPDGNLWFTGGAGVEQITPGGVVTSFALSENGQGLTARPDGNLWIASSIGIDRFTLGGTQAAPTTTILAADVNPAVSGQPVKLTATVTAAGTPAGTVTFRDGGRALGSSPVDAAGQATLSVALGAGSHSLTASFVGTSAFAASTSAALTEVVNRAATGTALTASANLVVVGQRVVFTATVRAVAPGAGTPTGTVTFLDGSTSLGSAALDAGGRATFSAAFSTAGSHVIRAVYGGDSNFVGSSQAITEQVTTPTAPAPTVTSLVASANPVRVGQTVTFTASVSGAAGTGTPSGTITFFAANVAVRRVRLNASGKASLTGHFVVVGKLSIRAVYSGDSHFAASAQSITEDVI
jgi:streptogramin lyase